MEVDSCVKLGPEQPKQHQTIPDTLVLEVTIARSKQKASTVSFANEHVLQPQEHHYNPSSGTMHHLLLSLLNSPGNTYA